MNVVAIVGRLVRDPELKHTPSGMAVCSMRLAVDRAGQKDGDEIKPGFFDIDVWKDRAEWAAQYLAKGSRIGVSGELRFREWEAQDGSKRNAVSINAFKVDFMETKSERQEREGGDGGQQSFTPAGAASTGDDFGGAADDDIPF